MLAQPKTMATLPVTTKWLSTSALKTYRLREVCQHISTSLQLWLLKIETIADQKPNSLLSQRELAEKYYENNNGQKPLSSTKR